MNKFSFTDTRISYANVKEYLELVWINLGVQVRSFIECLRVAIHYYSNLSFAKVDLFLLISYLFQNPFTISKRFLQKKGEKDVYAYGETPLTSLDMITKECKVSAKDTVFELGCGRGRTCFWLHSIIGCKVVGIEYVPEFVERSNAIKDKFEIKNIEFRQEDMLNANYSGATVVYLYGTCLDDPSILKIVDKCKALPAGTKIITISYPLTDYTDQPVFEVMKRFPARFTWGLADVYLQIRK